MSTLRDEIRTILREELATLQNEAMIPVTESIRISSSADLCRFAQDILARAASPSFVDSVTGGQLKFVLAGTSAAHNAQPLRAIVSSAAPTGGVALDKPLITESDIANLGSGARSLRVSSSSRITPLANDEARRKGIRIERIKA